MKARRSLLHAALGVIVLVPCLSLGAQAPLIIGSDLAVCNKGTVGVEVVSATRGSDLLRGIGKYYWVIDGETIAPHACTMVENRYGDPAYIAFGLTDSKGVWGGGTIARVPDIGSVQRTLISNPEKVLTDGAKVMCARRDATLYSMNDEFSTDCATVKLTGDGPDRGHGAFFPLTSAVLFHPEPHACGRQSPAGVEFGPYECEATHYYLNIYPSATDPDLHAVAGTKSGVDGVVQSSSENGDLRVLRALAKALVDAGARKAKADAEAADAQEHQLRQRAVTREENEKRILAADAAGDPNVKVEAQMLRRDAETNRERWAGTRQSPSAYDPQWMGQNLVVVGTVSRVEVDPKGYPQWVTIYFKESPDAVFVFCSPYPDMFQERVGLNLSTLVGKMIEAAGEVESAKCGPKASKASIRLVDSKGWQIH